MSNAVKIRKINETNVRQKDNVIIFPNVKLRKDGLPKQTKNNTKKNRPTIYPFKEEDIPRVIDYLADKIRYSRKHTELTHRRNYALFVMGINIGLRVSDLIALKWCDIFTEDWEFLSGHKFKPKKQQREYSDGRKKTKILILQYNDTFKKAVLDYKNYCKPTDRESYLFPSREKRGEHICDEVVRNLINKIKKDLDIKYNISTHSLRKTFARVRYDRADDKEDILIMLAELFGHEDLRTTRRYLCITEERIKGLFDSVNLGFDAINEIGDIKREL